MKYAEIIKEENEKDIFQTNEWKKFITLMAKNTNPEIVNFLFENPLFRAFSPSMEWGILFGVKPIIKERKPRDTPLLLQNMIDEYLKKKGFTALRSNSIFATRNFSLAYIFTKDDNMFIIFPPKKFYFTWNPYISDFYLESLFDNALLQYSKKFDLFQLNLEKIFQNPKLKSLASEITGIYIKVLSKNHLDYEEKKLILSLEKENKHEEIMKEIQTKLKKDNNVYNDFMLEVLKFLMKNYSLHDFQKILSINEKSEIAKKFDNKNFEEAVKSGNEIMITDTEYFYINHNFFFSHKDTIKKEYHAALNKEQK